MLNLILWLALLAGLAALVLFAWRSAMRRRGFKLLKLLEAEDVLRYAVDVPVHLGDPPRGASSRFSRRGTIVLTRKRLAGFSHRSRFVFVRGAGVRRDGVTATGEWLTLRVKRGAGAGSAVFSFRVPEAEQWCADTRRVLKI